MPCQDLISILDCQSTVPLLPGTSRLRLSSSGRPVRCRFKRMQIPILAGGLGERIAAHTGRRLSRSLRSTAAPLSASSWNLFSKAAPEIVSAQDAWATRKRRTAATTTALEWVLAPLD